MAGDEELFDLRYDCGNAGGKAEREESHIGIQPSLSLYGQLY